MPRASTDLATVAGLCDYLQLRTEAAMATSAGGADAATAG